MSAPQQRFWTVLLGLHLCLVLAIALQDVASTLAEANTFLPARCKPALTLTASVASAAVGKSLELSSPLRQVLGTYTDCAGIEVGYSYFAPKVPGNSKLAFELHDKDGRVDYDLPLVGGEAAGYRVSTLLDHLRAIHYRRLREAIIQRLVASIWEEHREAVTVRAVFGVANLTTPATYRAGERTSYRALYAYDFRFQPKSAQPAPP